MLTLTTWYIARIVTRVRRQLLFPAEKVVVAGHETMSWRARLLGISRKLSLFTPAIRFFEQALNTSSKAQKKKQ